MNSECFSTSRYQLDLEYDDQVRRIALKDTYSGVAFADSDYRYSAFVEYDGRIVRLEGLRSPSLIEEPWHRGGRRVSISGVLGEPGGSARIAVYHRFYIPEDDDFLEERLVLHNLSVRPVVMRGYRFGFRKRLERPKQYGGPGIDIENYRLVALPFRLQPDGRKHDYQLDDIYHGRYQSSVFHNPARLVQEVVDGSRARSEGWAWTDGENGLLVLKYNHDSVEFSMLDTECADGQSYLNFGGASASLYNEPIEARELAPGEEFTFGKSRYVFYEGLWRRGAYMFREHMSGLGHGLPDNYDPPVHWNVLFNTGWHHNDRGKLAECYNLETIKREAERARAIGCERLYLDPGWEVCEGGTAWDEERLGDAREFVSSMRDEYGLKVGLRTVGRSYCDDYHGMYRRRLDGSVGYYAPYSTKPFYEPCMCSGVYRQEKLRRILALADAGIDFIMFDEFDWRGPCSDPDHGHSVPTTPNMHAIAVTELVREVHAEHPEITIEMHDPVWSWGVRYLPMYYLHDGPGTFDEAWAFGFAWNPLEDLLSGKAISLFYYNLAYDLPLYNHINMDNDNDQCLAFWWYASTVRHLGIGGGAGSEARFEIYKQAMADYLSMKDLYTRGQFYGIDELTHVHVLPEEGRCVVNAFNLTDTALSRKVEIRPNDLGLLGNLRVVGAPHDVVRGKLIIQLDIPPFSPIIVKLLSDEA